MVCALLDTVKGGGAERRMLGEDGETQSVTHPNLVALLEIDGHCAYQTNVGRAHGVSAPRLVRQGFELLPLRIVAFLRHRHHADRR